MSKTQKSLNAAEWFYSDRAPKQPVPAPRLESRAPGWFLVYGTPHGPVGVYGEAAARAKLAEVAAAHAATLRAEVLADWADMAQAAEIEEQQRDADDARDDTDA